MVGKFAKGHDRRTANVRILVIEGIDDALHGSVKVLNQSRWKKSIKTCTEEMTKSLTLARDFAEGSDRGMANFQIPVLEHLKNPWNGIVD